MPNIDTSQSENYQLLCTLSLFHEYVNARLQPEQIRLQLSQQAQRLCRNEGLIIKQTATQIMLLHKSENDPSYVSDVCLQFGIVFVEPDFFNISSQGLGTHGTVLLCSNEQTYKEGGIEYLHPNKVVDEHCINQLNELHLDTQIKDVSLIVKLHLKDLIEDSNKGIYKQEEYAIRFATRSLRWVYWIWIRNGHMDKLIEKKEHLALLKIQSDNSDVHFNQFGEVIEQSQQKRIGFISTASIKLGAKSSFGLSLAYQGDAEKKVLIENLVHPRPNGLELLDIDDNKQIVAASHVTL